MTNSVVPMAKAPTASAPRARPVLRTRSDPAGSADSYHHIITIRAARTTGRGLPAAQGPGDLASFSRPDLLGEVISDQNLVKVSTSIPGWTGYTGVAALGLPWGSAGVVQVSSVSRAALITAHRLDCGSSAEFPV